MKLAVALAAAALLATPAAAQGPPTDPDADITNGNAQRALNAAKARWKAKGPRSYRMVIQRRCFCPVQYTRPRTVRIHGGKLVTNVGELRDIATVPRLFRKIQKAIDDKVQNLDVTYDKTRGYPRDVFVDVSLMIADEEQGFGARSLKRL